VLYAADKPIAGAAQWPSVYYWQGIVCSVLQCSEKQTKQKKQKESEQIVMSELCLIGVLCS